jgi:hypothetical protein
MEPPAQLIETALMLPSAAISYIAGARLRENFPGKTILECAGCGFDLDGFAEAGHASLNLLNDLGYSQRIMAWRGCGNEERLGPGADGEPGLFYRISNAFVQVRWREATLQALQLKWQEAMSTQQAWFLIADSQAIAEAFYAAVCEWSGVPHGEVLVFEQGTWRKDRNLFAAIQSSSFSNLILAPGLKESLREDIHRFFTRREVYTRYGVPWKRGILLVGPPGNGKTHAVKALCQEMKVPALYVRSLEPNSMFHGSEHANISSVFEFARKTAPCLLILEDLDALIKPANRSFLLNELDGFAANQGVCVVATTNYPERLDASILQRPSRFDRKYQFDVPGTPERIAYLKLWNDQQEPALRLTTQGLDFLAELTGNFSFAYLKELCLASVMAWMNANDGASMDAIAKVQAENLAAQMRSQPGPDREQVTPLTRQQRFRKLIDGEA